MRFESFSLLKNPAVVKKCRKLAQLSIINSLPMKRTFNFDMEKNLKLGDSEDFFEH